VLLLFGLKRKETQGTRYVQESTNTHGKWPHFKIKYREIITNHMKRKYLKKCSGIELLINVMPDDGLIEPKHVVTILIF
jgi:hypothetical protein